MLEKGSVLFIGFLQAIGVVLYCTFVVFFMRYFMPVVHDTLGIYGFVFMLCLFVLSASITGSLVFGYPAYLVLIERNIKRALGVFGGTLFVLFTFIVGTAFLVTLLS